MYWLPVVCWRGPAVVETRKNDESMRRHNGRKSQLENVQRLWQLCTIAFGRDIA